MTAACNGASLHDLQAVIATRSITAEAPDMTWLHGLTKAGSEPDVAEIILQGILPAPSIRQEQEDNIPRIVLSRQTQRIHRPVDFAGRGIIEKMTDTERQGF